MERETFLQQIDDAFAYGQECLGLHPNPVQRRYAQHIANSFLISAEHGKGQALAEAETGTGKTLGYLVPALLFAANTGDRVIVATHTLALQRQIVSPGGDLERAIKMVQHVLPDAQIDHAVRIGMRNFVDIGKLEKLAAEEVICRKDADFAVFLSWAKSSKTGDLREYLESYGVDSFPCGLSADQVCLDPQSSKEAKALYQSHSERARGAQVLITNHALLVLHAKLGRWILHDKEDTRKIAAIIVDECDQLPNAASSLLSNTLSLRRFAAALAQVEEDATRTGNTELADVARTASIKVDTIECFLREWDDQSRNDAIFLDDLHSYQRLSFLAHCAEASDILKDFYPPLKKVTHALLDSISEVVEMLDTFSAFLEYYLQSASTYSLSPILSLRFSPQKRYVSVCQTHLYPARILRRVWQDWVDAENQDKNSDAQARLLILTSATISAPTKSGMADIRDMVMQYGLWEKDNPCAALNLDCRFFPENFGDMRFVFSDYRAPSIYLPVKKGEEEPEEDEEELVAQINPDWILYAGKVIRHAAQAGGRMLVLTNSYRTAQAITDPLADLSDRILLKSSTLQTRQAIEKLRDMPDGIYITPGDWAGLDMGAYQDTEGQRMTFSQLVIIQIPISRPNSPADQALYRHLRSRGYGEQESRRNVYLQNRDVGLRKLKQGLGRGIRGPKDQCTVWFADPRMPRSRKMELICAGSNGRWKLAKYAIPDRFREGILGSNWDSGCMVSTDGTLVSSEQIRSELDLLVD